LLSIILAKSIVCSLSSTTGVVSPELVGASVVSSTVTSPEIVTSPLVITSPLEL